MRENIRYKPLKEGKALTERQHLFLEIMLQEKNIDEAARQLHIGQSTAYRWMALPQMQEHYTLSRQELFEAGIAKLKSSINTAVDTLVDTLEDTSVAPGVRVRAADVILSRSLDLHLMQSLESRLIALEQLILPVKETSVLVRTRQSRRTQQERIP